MNAESRRIRNIYLVLNQFIWLPTSLIVGVNTLFLLDGGLNNVEVFAANAISTLGLVVFERNDACTRTRMHRHARATRASYGPRASR